MTNNANSDATNANRIAGFVSLCLAYAFICLLPGGLQAEQPAKPASSPQAIPKDLKSAENSGQPDVKTGQKGAPTTMTLPHVRADRTKRQVEVDAVVNLREGEWLELLACTPQTKQHESILTIEGKPSHIHAGLLFLGLKPGKPMSYVKKGEHWQSVSAQGSKIEIFLKYKVGDSWLELPANTWIINQQNGKPLPDSIWLFAGSQLIDEEVLKNTKEKDPQKQIWIKRKAYAADIQGTAISLVGFGDEMLARDTTVDSRSDNKAWGVRPNVVPPVGSKVILILKAAK